MRLAKDLGQTLETVLEMSVAEIQLWLGFYNIEAKEHKRVRDKAKLKAQAKRR